MDDDLDDLLESHGIPRYRQPPYDGAHDYDEPKEPDHAWWEIAFVAALWLTAAGVAVALAIEIIN